MAVVFVRAVVHHGPWVPSFVLVGHGGHAVQRSFLRAGVKGIGVFDSVNVRRMKRWCFWGRWRVLLCFRIYGLL